MKLNARKIVVVGTALALITGGTAYAYIKASGTGSGTATAASRVPVVLEGTVTGLAPTGAEKSIEVKFKNENAFAVTAPNGIDVSITNLPTSCSASDFSVADITGSVLFAANTTTFTALPAYSGGTITWASSGTVDQTTCMDDIEDAPLGLSLTVNS